MSAQPENAGRNHSFAPLIRPRIEPLFKPYTHFLLPFPISKKPSQRLKRHLRRQNVMPRWRMLRKWITALRV